MRVSCDDPLILNREILAPRPTLGEPRGLRRAREAKTLQFTVSGLEMCLG